VANGSEPFSRIVGEPVKPRRSASSWLAMIVWVTDAVTPPSAMAVLINSAAAASLAQSGTTSSSVSMVRVGTCRAAAASMAVSTGSALMRPLCARVIR
jgi:hypothetical protein